MSDGPENVISWERLPDEPPEWFDRFDRYARKLGYEYSVVRAFRLFSVAQPKLATAENPAVWSQNAHRYQWKERARAWSDFDRFYNEFQWQQRRAEVREADFTISEKLRALADKIVATSKDFLKSNRSEEVDAKTGQKIVIIRQEIRLDTAIKALETASRIQRLSAELETNRDVQEVHLKQKAYVLVSPDDWDDQPDKPVQAATVANTSVEGQAESTPSNG